MLLAIGCVPARALVTNAPGAIAWTTAFAAACVMILVGLSARSAVVGTAGVVALGWMLSSTGPDLAAIWLTRLPLLAAAVVSGALWWDLAAPGRPVPRRHQLAARRVLARLRRGWA